MNTDYFRHLYNTTAGANSAWQGWYDTSSKFVDWTYNHGKFNYEIVYEENEDQMPVREKHSFVDDGSIQEFFDGFEIKKLC